jgi:molybdopterin/thiamine biosynthesis adenylyltransferase
MKTKLDIEAFADEIASPPVEPDLRWPPLFIGLEPDDEERFGALCRQHHLVLIDTIDRQLMDLAIARIPAPTQHAERARFIEEKITAAGGRFSLGTWVYFPWESKVVHLLNRDEYFEVITNRNQNKVTRDEQHELRRKRIGVIGLSVGGEAAVTVAQEHLCGHIVLADFDKLDLSNLNRLQAGCDELGHKKAMIVARRIAKIDPYIEVTVFEDGVTANNATEFLEGLDLLIEECDNLQVKRDLRLLAKERSLNVVYAADERGFLSVEPYRYWPELRPFHGRVEHSQMPREAYPTPLAFMQALAEWMGGWSNLSERSRRSLELIGESLCGYPQLASEARYAAGQVANVARRLLLGENIPPYLGNLDLADLVR